MSEDNLMKAIIELAKRVQAIEERLSSSVSLVSLDKEHDRVMHEMKVIEDTYAGHQAWLDRDRKRFRELKARRNELRSIIGIKY